jgi:hypothetical protein
MHQINFTCPHCKRKAEVAEEEICYASYRITALGILGWESDETGKFISAIDVEGEYDIMPETRPIRDEDPYIEDVHFICNLCLEEIDPEIKDSTDLFNWLYKHEMLKGEDPK